MSSATVEAPPAGPGSEPDQTTTPTPTSTQPRSHQPPATTVMGSLRLIELQLVAFIMLISLSGLIPLVDLIFPAFATAYILALSRLAFPAYEKTSEPREIFSGSPLFRLYIIVGTNVGLFLPLAYILGGFARGDEHAVRSATPHLFLMAIQILTENVVSGLSLFSPPVRAHVPLLYTVRRMFYDLDWIKDVWINKALPANAALQDIAWFWFGRVLAVANLTYFSINLFGFLLPRLLPRAYERYFKERDEVRAKMAEDKHSSALINNNVKQSDKKSN